MVSLLFSVYLRVVCLITHIKPDIIKFFFKHANDIVLIFFSLNFCSILLSSFWLNEWYELKTAALMLPQHHKIERVTMQTRISLLNFHTFFCINKWNQEIFALCLSHCDDFDSIICLSLTLIRLNNLIVVGNDIRHCLAFYRKGLKPHRYVALKRAQIIKTSNDMKTTFFFCCLESLKCSNFQWHYGEHSESIENSRHMALL